MSLHHFFSTTAKRKAGEAFDEVGNDPPVREPLRERESNNSSAGQSESASNIPEWLNGLDVQEARLLFTTMLSRVGSKRASTMSQTDRDALKGAQTRVPLSGRDGRWYVENYASHRLVDLKVGVNQKTGNREHPRWQLNITGLASGTAANAVKRSLTERSWRNLVAVAGGAKQVKLQCHHVAYNASSRRDATPLPGDLGRGSSVSHLCDTAGCVEPEHLEVASTHAENMDRQRCVGVLLCLVDGFITQEVPCTHGRGDSDSDRIQTSCRRVRIFQPDEVTRKAIMES